MAMADKEETSTRPRSTSELCLPMNDRGSKSSSSEGSKERFLIFLSLLFKYLKCNNQSLYVEAKQVSPKRYCAALISISYL